MKLPPVIYIPVGVGLLLIALAIGYLLPRPLFRWVPASYQEAQQSTFREADESSSAEVILLPVDTFNYDYAAELARELKTRTGLEVRAILPTPLDGLQPFPGTKQFSGTDMLQVVASTIERLRSDYGPALVIVLTNRDINQPERHTRFVFSFTDPTSKASIVSSSRLALGETTAVADLAKIKERVMKFSLRCIAEQHLKLPRTTDPDSVMFSPIMSLKDVDRMGTSIPKTSTPEN